MRRKILLLIFLSGMTGKKLFSQGKDSIILYKGQTLIGAIQGANLGAISIDDIDLKMLSIKLYKIRKLKIIERFKIETVERIIVYGTIDPSAKDGWIDIHTLDSMVVTIPITKIYQLISMDTDFFTRLNGNVSAGFSFTKSSAIGQLNLSAALQYATKKFNYNLNVSSIGSLDSNHFSRDNENAQLIIARDLTPTWFITAAALYQRNLELSINRRNLFMFGPGNKIVIKQDWRLMAATGITFSQERSTEGTSSGILWEIPIMFQFNFYRFHNPDIQISSTQTVYFSLSQAGRVRYDGNTNFSWQLIRYFYLNISPYSNFDSKPPAGSFSNFDYGIVIGLSYKF
jgi:hypothetical protein